MKPHPIIISLLTRVEDVIPKWKIVPTKDVIDSAFKDPVKREQVSSSRYSFVVQLRTPQRFDADTRQQVDISRETKVKDGA